MASGVETGKLGEWLSQRLHQAPDARGYRVFYDHGDKAKHPNVTAIQGFWGEQPTNMNRLADIDVVVVDGQDKVSILIECMSSNVFGQIAPKNSGEIPVIVYTNGQSCSSDLPSLARGLSASRIRPGGGRRPGP